ncbi:MAG: hypothetical protein FJY83_10225 [Candidatus Aminicenantes bacterium]|nr:hypothetical protein [Candidatus Aminicenantes bacterium]
MRNWEASYFGACLLVLALTVLHLKLYRRLESKAGRLHVRWSSLFHLGSLENIALLSLAAFAGASSLLLILRDPGSPDGYRRLLLLAFGLSLAPRRSVAVGSLGIVYKMRFLPWTSIKSMAYRKKGSLVVLRILFRSSPRSERIQMMNIPLPRDIDLDRPPDSPGFSMPKKDEKGRAVGKKPIGG